MNKCRNIPNNLDGKFKYYKDVNSFQIIDSHILMFLIILSVRVY